MKLTYILPALLLGFATLHSQETEARGHHGGSRFGFYFGSPFYGPSFYGPSYYRYSSPYYGYPDPYFYAPQTVITVPSTPPTYIQQNQPATSQNPSGYWYYCDNPEGYYPYVKECLNSWQPVEPTPPPTR